MEIKDYKFICDTCGHTWLSSDYSVMETEYNDGHSCPKCGSGDISGTPSLDLQ